MPPKISCAGFRQAPLKPIKVYRRGPRWDKGPQPVATAKLATTSGKINMNAPKIGRVGKKCCTVVPSAGIFWLGRGLGEEIAQPTLGRAKILPENQKTPK